MSNFIQPPPPAALTKGGEAVARDREADRARFADAAFNNWLDEGISDSGHTIWDAVGDVSTAWSGWCAREFYGTTPPAAQVQAEDFVHGEYIRGYNDAVKNMSAAQVQHPDDVAVDRFATAMKAKLADARAKGRGGWEDKDQCSQQLLSDLLRGHVDKGDPRDVANFCMMLWCRHEAIAAHPAAGDKVRELVAKWRNRRNVGDFNYTPDHPALIAIRECADELEAALDQPQEADR